MRILNTENKKVSVIIANYNKASFLDECIKSIEDQNYYNIQTIVVDNKSTDNSLDVLEKYKKIILIRNRMHSNVGSYDQLNAYRLALSKANGEIIFFLDSDDFFKKNKIINLLKIFNDNAVQICSDLPISYCNSNNQFKKKFFRKNFLLSPWPKFSPHSCICVRREYLAKIFKIISIKKFPEVWMDFRVLIYAYLEFGVNNILEKHLTFYRQYEFQSTSSYKLLSKKWLKRRLQSHKFYNYVCKKLDKNKSHNHDFFVTSLLYKVFKTI
jgi:glycosyltransferase involved in cell wall biosynthesis